MAHQVIKYRLTENGEVPDFLCTEENSEGGAYGVYDDVFPSPRNYVMVGISCDGATGDFETFSTKNELQSYLSTVGADWHTYTEEYSPVETQPETWDVGKYPFDPVVAADQTWAKMEALNANQC